MERLTERMTDGTADCNCSACPHYKAYGDEYYCDYDSGCIQKIIDRLCELEDKLESGLLIELPNGWLDTLKLLTCAAMCYADIESMIANGMKDSEELANLFFSIPRVQGSVNDIALKQLAESKIDCDKIKSVEEVLNAMPIFKRRFQDN